jgi:RNA polymerase sigma factor (sigma-70 family)
LVTAPATAVRLEDESDATLVGLACQGDADAFAELYRRYAGAVHDFALRITRNAEDAADITQDAFIKAFRGIQTLENPGHFKSWVFTIARNTAFNRLRTARRVAPAVGPAPERPVFGLGLEIVDPDQLSDPALAAEAKASSRFVWEAAAGLSPGDYALLDLHVRRELGGAEIAQVLGTSPNAVYVRLNRVKKSFERSARALCLMNAGQRACDELRAELAERAVTRLSPLAVRVIDRHMERCERCRDESERLVSPLAVFAALGPVAVNEALRTAILAATAGSAAAAATAATGSGAGGGAGTAVGAGAAGTQGGSGLAVLAGQPFVWAAAAIAAVAVAIGAVFAPGLLDSGSVPPAAMLPATSQAVATGTPTGTATATPATPSTPETSPTPLSTALAVSVQQPLSAGPGGPPPQRPAPEPAPAGGEPQPVVAPSTPPSPPPPPQKPLPPAPPPQPVTPAAPQPVIPAPAPVIVFELPQSADLRATLSGIPPFVSSGGLLQVTLTISNLGPGGASAVTATIALPPGLQVLASVPAGACQPAPGGLSCGIGTLAPGASLSIQLSLRAVAGGDSVITASVASQTNDPALASNSASASVFVVEAGLALAMQASPAASAGTPATVTLSVANTGNSALGQVVVTSAISPAAPALKDTAARGAMNRMQPSCVLNLRSGDRNGDGRLDPSETWTYSCDLALAATATVTVTVTAVDIAGALVTQSATVAVLVAVPAPAIRLDAAASAPAGKPPVVTYTVSNPGGVALSAVALSDSSGCQPITLVSGDTDADGQLDPGETWQYRCSPTAFPSETNSATVTASAGAGVTVSALAQYFVDLPPALSLARVVSPSSLVEPGGEGKVTARVTNTGTEPIELFAVEDTQAGSLAKACALPVTIAPKATFECGGTAKFEGKAGTLVAGTLTIAVRDDERNEVKAQASSSVAIVAAWRLNLEVHPERVRAPGQKVEAELEITNAGSQMLRITSVEAQGFEPGSASGSCTRKMDVAPGGKAACSLNVTVAGQAGTQVRLVIQVRGTLGEHDVTGTVEAIIPIEESKAQLRDVSARASGGVSSGSPLSNLDLPRRRPGGA